MLSARAENERSRVRIPIDSVNFSVACYNFRSEITLTDRTEQNIW